MNSEINIINALLDKYERSKSYKSGKPNNRRILLKLYDGTGKSDFNYYDISDHDKRIEINKAIEQLSNNGLVFSKWYPGERGHILKEVWLDYDQIDNAYKFVGRTQKAVTVETITEEIQQLNNNISLHWIKTFLEDILTKSKNNRDFGNSLPKDKKERTDLFNLLLFIDKKHELEITERILSSHLYSDSKRFDKALRSRLLSILKKFYDIENVFDDGDDLLRQVGIVKYPEFFDFCGMLILSNQTGYTDFTPLSHGGSFCVIDLENGVITISEKIKKIISIENRANYIEYISKTKREDELILFHAGQLSPARKMFFSSISSAMPENCTWYHWGDIDLGGFYMLARLRREINPFISSFRMDKENLIKYKNICGKTDFVYAAKLQNLLQKKELFDCVECIQYMIDNNIRLEQEAMLF